MDWYLMHRVIVSVSVHLHKSWLIWLCIEKYEWYEWIVMHLWGMVWAWLICLVLLCELLSIMFGTWVVILYGVVRILCMCIFMLIYILVRNDIIILFLTLLLFWMLYEALQIRLLEVFLWRWYLHSFVGRLWYVALGCQGDRLVTMCIYDYL